MFGDEYVCLVMMCVGICVFGDGYVCNHTVVLSEHRVQASEATLAHCAYMGGVVGVPPTPGHAPLWVDAHRHEAWWPQTRSGIPLCPTQKNRSKVYYQDAVTGR